MISSGPYRYKKYDAEQTVHNQTTTLLFCLREQFDPGTILNNLQKKETLHLFNQ